MPNGIDSDRYVDRPTAFQSSTFPASLRPVPSPVTLPMNVRHVKRWLKAKMSFSSQSSAPSSSASSFSSNTGKRAFLSDLLRPGNRKAIIIPSSESTSDSTHSSRPDSGLLKRREAGDVSSNSPSAELSEGEAAAEMSSKRPSRQMRLSTLLSPLSGMEGYVSGDDGEKMDKREAGKRCADDAERGRTNGSIKSKTANVQRQSINTSSMGLPRPMLEGRTIEANGPSECPGMQDRDEVSVVGRPRTDEFVRVQL
jgi:hypothetical protein